MPDFKIRPLHDSDLPAVIQLCRAHAEFESLVFDPTGKVEALRCLLASKPCPVQVRVVESDVQEIVGYCSYMIQYSTWQANRYVYMDCLYLEPDWRRRGIGKLLLKEITRYAQTQGCPEIRWQTSFENSTALGFYDSLPGSSRSVKYRYRLQKIPSHATSQVFETQGKGKS